MTMAQLRDKCYRVQTATIPVNAKWYADDCASIRRAIAKKNKAQLLETIARWQSINSVTQAEINANCQFGGLPKIGR